MVTVIDVSGSMKPDDVRKAINESDGDIILVERGGWLAFESKGQARDAYESHPWSGASPTSEDYKDVFNNYLRQRGGMFAYVTDAPLCNLLADIT